MWEPVQLKNASPNEHLEHADALSQVFRIENWQDKRSYSLKTETPYILPNVLMCKKMVTKLAIEILPTLVRQDTPQNPWNRIFKILWKLLQL